MHVGGMDFAVIIVFQPDQAAFATAITQALPLILIHLLQRQFGPKWHGLIFSHLTHKLRGDFNMGGKAKLVKCLNLRQFIATIDQNTRITGKAGGITGNRDHQIDF